MLSVVVRQFSSNRIASGNASIAPSPRSTSQFRSVRRAPISRSSVSVLTSAISRRFSTSDFSAGVAHAFEGTNHVKYPGCDRRQCAIEACKETRSCNIHSCCFGVRGGLGSAARDITPSLICKHAFVAMRHFFVDEAGDLTLFDRRGRSMLGRDGVEVAH